jgi:hypothetical protein
MNQVALSYYGGAGDELAKLFAEGSEKSMGPNVWNPNPT